MHRSGDHAARWPAAEFGLRLREIISAAAGIPLPGEPRLLVSAMNSMLDQFAYTEEVIDTLTDLLHRGIAGTPPGGFAAAT
jgi:hypothetical protein